VTKRVFHAAVAALVIAPLGETEGNQDEDVRICSV